MARDTVRYGTVRYGHVCDSIYICFADTKIGTLGVHVSAQRNSMVTMKKIHNY